MTNVVELNAGKSKIEWDDAVFMEKIKAKAVNGYITMKDAVASFWESAGNLYEEIKADGAAEVERVETDIKSIHMPSFAHLFRRAGIRQPSEVQDAVRAPQSLAKDTSGVTSVEYAFLGFFAAVGVLGFLNAYVPLLDKLFDFIHPAVYH